MAYDINKSGGPAHPTLSGGIIDDKTFRWEGFSLFDYYVGQGLAAGQTPSAAVRNAARAMELRNDHLIVKEAK